MGRAEPRPEEPGAPVVLRGQEHEVLRCVFITLMKSLTHRSVFQEEQPQMNTNTLNRVKLSQQNLLQSPYRFSLMVLELFWPTPRTIVESSVQL